MLASSFPNSLHAGKILGYNCLPLLFVLGLQVSAISCRFHCIRLIDFEKDILLNFFVIVRIVTYCLNINNFTNTCASLRYDIVIHIFLMSQVNIDHNSGIFITMNPAGKGYGGRQKLPDNLKQLFRPVAMSRPDNEQIAEVILFSEGFKLGKSLGRKLVAIFNLSK